MKIKATLLGLTVLLFLAFFSCKTGKGKADESNDMVYDTISISEIYHIANDSTKPFCSLDIQYVYPLEYSDMDLLATIQSELNYVLLEDEKYEKLSPVEAVDKYVVDYIDNYKHDVEEQFPEWEKSGEAGDYFSYRKTLKSELKYSKGGLISYQMVSTDDKGGANSSRFSRNVVIDLETGNTVNEKDIFSPNYKDALNALLIDKIMKQNNVTNVEDLVAYGYIGVEDLTSNNNFFVDEQGITYVFNPGGYSIFTLEIRVFIPYVEIRSMLKEDSPISNLAGL